ncbi:MAG: hypothetical protein AVO38_02395 [delta proteobacterium ML8_D]|jgi:hypothetical protein|nr:MAG: hypothetical protein AVO38_02395 [delta proteobacterium ML8_D]
MTIKILDCQGFDYNFPIPKFISDVGFKVNEQKGTVLVMVLWVLALLTLVGGFYAVEARIRRNLGQYAWDALQGRETARSILLFAERKLSPPGTEKEEDEDSLFADGSLYKVNFGGREVGFMLEDENGKLDLNNSSDDQIRNVVRTILGDEELEAADTIVDGILDWKDSDKLVRLNGAEDDVYQDMSPPYYPANGPFRLLEELLLVNGVGHEVFYGPISWLAQDEEDSEVLWQGGLWNLFTIYNKSGEVSKGCAPLPLEEILGNELIDDTTSTREVVCLRVWFGSRIYQVYWNPKSEAEVPEIKHWTEAVALGSKGSRW